MEAEQLRAVLEVFQSMGVEAKSAFIWWLVITNVCDAAKFIGGGWVILRLGQLFASVLRDTMPMPETTNG